MCPDALQTSSLSQETENSTIAELRYVYIFVNPTSGGNRAAAITNIGAETFRFRDPGIECKIFIHDIRTGESGHKPGFIHLKEQLAKKKYVCVPA